MSKRYSISFQLFFSICRVSVSISATVLEVLRKVRKTSVRIDGVPAGTQPGHFPNIIQNFTV
jgi:hypothetical protein